MKWKFTELSKIKLLLQIAIDYFHVILRIGNRYRLIKASMVAHFNLFYGFIADDFYNTEKTNGIFFSVKIFLKTNFLLIFFKTICDRNLQHFIIFFDKKIYDFGWVNDLAVFYPGGSIKLAEGWVN